MYFWVVAGIPSAPKVLTTHAIQATYWMYAIFVGPKVGVIAIEVNSVITLLITFSRPNQPVFRAMVLVFDMSSLTLILEPNCFRLVEIIPPKYLVCEQLLAALSRQLSSGHFKRILIVSFSLPHATSHRTMPMVRANCTKRATVGSSVDLCADRLL